MALWRLSTGRIVFLWQRSALDIDHIIVTRGASPGLIRTGRTLIARGVSAAPKPDNPPPTIIIYMDPLTKPGEPTEQWGCQIEPDTNDQKPNEQEQDHADYWQEDKEGKKTDR